MTPPNPTPADLAEADAASLRRAFNAFAEAWHAGNLGPMTAAQRDVWAALYEAVRDHQAGLKVLVEVQRLHERVELCKLELADTDAWLASANERNRELRERMEKWAIERGEQAA